jgi:hypothetical protein
VNIIAFFCTGMIVLGLMAVAGGNTKDGLFAAAIGALIAVSPRLYDFVLGLLVQP